MFTRLSIVAVVVASFAATAALADNLPNDVTGSIRSSYDETEKPATAKKQQNEHKVANLGGGFLDALFSDGNDNADVQAGQTSTYAPHLRGRNAKVRAQDEAELYQQVPTTYTAYQDYSDDARPAQVEIDPQFLPQVVDYNGHHTPGTIVINTNDRFLYLVLAGGKARRYGVGVGRPGFTWRGEHRVSMKREWPDWRPPAEMLKRRPDLPKYMAGGPLNPLGARALYLGSSIYRIHGSNEPETIGQAVSSGCIRMRNEDVMDLYTRVGVGTRVLVN